MQFFPRRTQDENGFNIYILDESNRVEVYHHCEGSKEELVRDVSRLPRHRTTVLPDGLKLHQLQPAAVLSDCEG
ncbi:class I adenylate cyclase [Escherichia coli]|uniref:class I adenylate cyclase n=1 Tax=Escherichia coli TaxID=562 RepID=UPI00388DA445